MLMRILQRTKNVKPTLKEPVRNGQRPLKCFTVLAKGQLRKISGICLEAAF